MKLVRPALLLAVMLSALPAWALDYVSVANPTIMYDAPSLKARPLYIVKAGTPVEAVINVDGFVKVRDSQGILAWIDKAQLSDKRTLLVRSDRAQIRVEANDNAPLAFEAVNGVILDMMGGPVHGWIPVRHRDGQSGFIKTLQVFGL